MSTKEERRAQAHWVIHSASAASAAAASGLAQIPMSDNAVLVPIQVAMLLKLGNIYGVSMLEAGARSFLSELIASNLGKFVARTAVQWLGGWIPFAGNAINASTAAAFTEAIGWAAVDDFELREI